MKKLETTSVGDYSDVILTAGMTVQTTDGKWQRIFGIFDCEDDARSEDADTLALGTVTESSLTPQQVTLAERNTESL